LDTKQKTSILENKKVLIVIIVASALTISAMFIMKFGDEYFGFNTPPGVGPIGSEHVHGKLKVYIVNDLVDFDPKKYPKYAFANDYISLDENKNIHRTAKGATVAHLLESMDITYTDIRNELRKRGLSHGATTFQMLVVTPSEKQDNQALALVYSFGSTRNRNGKSDLGPVLFYGPDGALSNSYFMGINQPDQFMTGDGRLLNYDLQAYRIPSGGKVVLTTDGNLNPDNLTEKQTNVKKGENFRQFFRKITGSGRGEVNPDDTSLVSITVGDDIKRVSSIKK